MSILSLEYLLFVAAAFAAYYLLPLRRRWWALLAASAAFYCLSGWRGAAYLGAVTCVTWLGALGIARFSRGRKALLGCVLTLTLGAMAFLKYAGFWVSGLWLPLGLSWFTFQSAGYVIDVYRRKASPERNPARYLLFVSFFPQMAQGPISTYGQLTPQLFEGHRLLPQQVQRGVVMMAWGYFKKLVIADRLAAVTTYALSGVEQPGWLPLLAAVVYMLRLYADFSGGMDVIRGTAAMLGIDMTENFRRPFFARSVADYWRRWHISLGAWFRSCLLYPFATSRAGLAVGRGASRVMGKKLGRLMPSVLATLVIFLLIGLWHGASWNAALYGLYFGLVMSGGMLLEPWLKAAKRRLGIPAKHPALAALGLIRTWLAVALAQFFAFAQDTPQALSLLGHVFQGWTGFGVVETLLAVMPALEWWIALGGLALLGVVDALNERGADVEGRLARGSLLARWPVLVALIVAIVVLGCYGDGFDGSSFLYTQF